MNNNYGIGVKRKGEIRRVAIMSCKVLIAIEDFIVNDC